MVEFGPMLTDSLCNVYGMECITTICYNLPVKYYCALVWGSQLIAMHVGSSNAAPQIRHQLKGDVDARILHNAVIYGVA